MIKRLSITYSFLHRRRQIHFSSKVMRTYFVRCVSTAYIGLKFFSSWVRSIRRGIGRATTCNYQDAERFPSRYTARYGAHLSLKRAFASGLEGGPFINQTPHTHTTAADSRFSLFCSFTIHDLLRERWAERFKLPGLGINI